MTAQSPAFAIFSHHDSHLRLQLVSGRASASIGLISSSSFQRPTRLLVASFSFSKRSYARLIRTSFRSSLRVVVKDQFQRALDLRKSTRSTTGAVALRIGSTRTRQTLLLFFLECSSSSLPFQCSSLLLLLFSVVVVKKSSWWWWWWWWWPSLPVACRQWWSLVSRHDDDVVVRSNNRKYIRGAKRRKKRKDEREFLSPFIFSTFFL